MKNCWDSGCKQVLIGLESWRFGQLARRIELKSD
jgi:hypothetical protein